MRNTILFLLVAIPIISISQVLKDTVMDLSKVKWNYGVERGTLENISIEEFESLWQKTHKHKPATQKIKVYDPLLYVDSTKIKYNVITYLLRNDSCKVCHLWYKTRQNVDTFSTRRPAKYSNLKYPKRKH